jgi:DeoR family transcriptional regulator, fructose operon transcriptional repressor
MDRMNSVRREKILRFLRDRGDAGIKEICASFPDVSLMTIHRDLAYLESTGGIVRVHGGARAAPGGFEPGYGVREGVNRAVKAAMAKKAVSLVGNEAMVYIDGGTSCMAVAREFPNITASLFTTGPNIAMELIKLPKPSVNLCCGNLNHESLVLSGQITLDMLKGINIDIAFIGISGYRQENGFTCGLDSEARVKKLVIGKARKTIGLVDNSKLGKIFPFTFAQPEDFDILVCEEGAPGDFLEQMKLSKCIIV